MTSHQECRKRGGDDPGEVRLILGDCLDVLRSLDSASVDAVVTDPPAGIAFMGKDWDRNRGGRREWIAWLSSALAECLRVAKPGSILLCWALPRTSHWTGTAIEDAGWIIENRVAHIFGSGFPKRKSHLKPAVEDWWVARKPDGEKWLGVEACRIGTSKPEWKLTPGRLAHKDLEGYGHREGRTGPKESHTGYNPNIGRWPANLVLSHSPGCNGTCVEDCPIRLMGEQSGESRSSGGINGGTLGKRIYGKGFRNTDPHVNSGGLGDSGTAARFFANFDADPFLYCPKASRKDRGEGNTHPTVKPTGLMRWLCRLATPEGGTVLDPFMGSGSTGVAAVQLGLSFVGIEQSAEHHECAIRRIEAEQARYPLFPETSRVVMA